MKHKDEARTRKLALSEIPGSLLNDGITEVEVPAVASSPDPDPSTESGVQAERKAFEAWAIPKITLAPVRRDDGYAHIGLQWAWESWQARAALLRSRMERAGRWKRLPDEQAWWWHWNGENYAIPHVCSVMVSKTGPDRYFVADGHNAPWCDEMGGFWLKIGYPNVPSREQVKQLTALPSAPDAEEKAK